MSLEHVNYCKVYRETGNIYFFDHLRFSEAIDSYCEANHCKKTKLYEDISTEIYASIESVKAYKSMSRRDRRVPKEIEDCKKLGQLLCKNEYVFLRRFIHDGEELSIKKVHIMLYDIFSLYDTSNCFNEVPATEQAHELAYYNERLDKIQKVIDCELYEESEETKRKLTEIVNDSRIFIKSYSIPGVVDAWLAINPSLKYFDPVFDIMERDYKLYEKIKANNYGEFHFRLYPSFQELKDKKAYFTNLEHKNSMHNFDFSIERFYQDELLQTINLIFKKFYN